MWRKETNEDRARKRAEELQKNAPPPINPHPAPTQQVTPEEARQAYEAAGCGWCPELGKKFKYALYVVCCCGCTTSYEDFEDQFL